MATSTDTQVELKDKSNNSVTTATPTATAKIVQGEEDDDWPAPVICGEKQHPDNIGRPKAKRTSKSAKHCH